MDEQVVALILAGFETRPEQAKKNKRRLRNAFRRISYMEGVNKALIGADEVGYSILQKEIDTLNSSSNIKDVVVVGPRESFVEAGIEGCIFIDRNESLGTNLMSGLKELKGEWVAVASSDTPYIETEHIDTYMVAAKSFMDTNDFIYQLVRKRRDSINQGSKWKPAYPMKRPRSDESSGWFVSERVWVLPGHFQIVNASAVTDFLYKALQFLYDTKGERVIPRVIHAGEHFPEKTNTIISYLPRFLGLQLHVSQLEGLVETVMELSTHVEITDQTSFAMDVDDGVRERSEAIDYLRAKAPSSRPIANLPEYHPSSRTGESRSVL